ncbi:MAG: hypothetical protein IKN43_11350 [Selenomonadaceae bacterium]|nr:hypothetical protein [Selenomonadaceae bacterium]
MRRKKELTFMEMIVRFIIILLFAGFLKLISSSMCSFGSFGYFFIFIAMFVAGYALWLRIQWDRKIIKKIKENYKHYEKDCHT